MSGALRVKIIVGKEQTLPDDKHFRLGRLELCSAGAFAVFDARSDGLFVQQGEEPSCFADDSLKRAVDAESVLYSSLSASVSPQSSSGVGSALHSKQQSAIVSDSDIHQDVTPELSEVRVSSLSAQGDQQIVRVLTVEELLTLFRILHRKNEEGTPADSSDALRHLGGDFEVFCYQLLLWSNESSTVHEPKPNLAELFEQFTSLRMVLRVALRRDPGDVDSKTTEAFRKLLIAYEEDAAVRRHLNERGIVLPKISNRDKAFDELWKNTYTLFSTFDYLSEFRSPLLQLEVEIERGNLVGVRQSVDQLIAVLTELCKPDQSPECTQKCVNEYRKLYRERFGKLLAIKSGSEDSSKDGAQSSRRNEDWEKVRQVFRHEGFRVLASIKDLALQTGLTSAFRLRDNENQVLSPDELLAELEAHPVRLKERLGVAIHLLECIKHNKPIDEEVGKKLASKFEQGETSFLSAA